MTFIAQKEYFLMHKTKETIGTENTAKNTDQAETKAYFLSSFLTKA